MNIRLGLGIIVLIVVFLAAGIGITLVGSFQEDLTSRLVEGDTLNEEGDTSLQENTNRFPSLFDTALLIVFVSIVGAVLYVSYLVNRPGLSILVGVLFVFLTVWVSGTITLFWTSITESYSFTEQLPFTNFILSNLEWVVSGTVVGSTITSTLRGGF